jgi:transposase
MTNIAMWAKRVAEWRSSGLTSVQFCEGKPFTAGGLRHAAHQLREEQRNQPAKPRVRMARVQRTPVRAVVPETVRGAPVSATESALVVELGRARISVRPGFDRATLAAVLEVLVTPGGER